MKFNYPVRVATPFLLMLVLAVGSASSLVRAEDGSDSDDAQKKAADAALRTAREFVQAFEKGDTEAAEKIAVPLADEKLAERRQMAYKQMAEMIKQGMLAIKTFEAKAQGDWACVVMRYTFTKGEQKEHRLKEMMLLQDGDKWFVTSEVTMRDQNVKPKVNDDFKALFKWFRDNQNDFRRKYVETDPG